MEHSFLCMFELFLFSTLIHGSDEVPSKPSVILNPKRLIYSGDTVTLTCQIQGDGGTQWTYEWKQDDLNKQGTNDKTIFLKATESDSGNYSCRGIKGTSTSEWSDVITLTVYHLPVLTVSPSWLSPGASVTLSCEVKDPSAGWRFYWYKAVPEPSTTSYIYELLPGSTSGTEQDSYIIDGQTHTAGYACRAGRGDPVIYSPYSQTEMVWSADPRPSASLTVSPDRVQHFTSDSVSLTCEGNSSEWRVRRSAGNSYTSLCSYWGTMKGSTCVFNGLQSNNSVYWCESGSLFSNAVNLTGQNYHDIILVSPVHPVTEGASVSLSCRLRRQNQLSSVFFYHNDKLIQNDSREELHISAVSQSEEGFYKCQHSGNVSPQSWMSVKTVSRSENSSFPVLLIVGPVSVLLPILLLLLLCCCRQFKGAADETVGSSEITGTDAHESQDVTYSQIHIKRKKTGQKRGHHEPEEDTVYSNVSTRTSGRHHKPKESTIYSDLKTITAGRVSYNNSTPVDDDIN